MNQLTSEDIAALRADGDLTAALLALAGRTPAKPAPLPAEAPDEPAYRIAHKGSWPIGTAATGPTPTHGRCTCPKCEQAAVVQLPRPHDHAQDEDAA